MFTEPLGQFRDIPPYLVDPYVLTRGTNFEMFFDTGVVIARDVIATHNR
jgi:hypothetical protein